MIKDMRQSRRAAIPDARCVVRVLTLSSPREDRVRPGQSKKKAGLSLVPALAFCYLCSTKIGCGSAKSRRKQAFSCFGARLSLSLPCEDKHKTNMPSIRLKNIGPLTDTGVVEMKKVTLFIGAQSTGKSTLMKILCFCRWLEKHIMAGDDKATLYNYTHYNRFLRELKQFHRFNDGYFNADSEIDYRGSLLDITLHGTKNARITKHADFDQLRCNAKLCFIPSERNLISALRNADRAYKASNIDMLFNYVFE